MTLEREPERDSHRLSRLSAFLVTALFSVVPTTAYWIGHNQLDFSGNNPPLKERVATGLSDIGAIALSDSRFTPSYHDTSFVRTCGTGKDKSTSTISVHFGDKDYNKKTGISSTEPDNVTSVEVVEETGSNYDGTHDEVYPFYYADITKSNAGDFPFNEPLNVSARYPNDWYEHGRSTYQAPVDVIDHNMDDKQAAAMIDVIVGQVNNILSDDPHTACATPTPPQLPRR